MGDAIFENAKPKLLGADTHSAGITGDVQGVDPVTQIGFPNVDGGGGSGDFSDPEKVYATNALVATKPINKGFLRRFTPFDRNNNGGTFRLREDDINGTILQSVSYLAGNGTSSASFQVIITNQPVGSRTYVYTRQQNGGGFTRLHAGANTLVYIVDIDDTKVPVLNGTNTQHVQESGVIP